MRPSASVRYGPSPDTMKRGLPPTARKARTGELTPPGTTRSARRNSSSEAGAAEGTTMPPILAGPADRSRLAWTCLGSPLGPDGRPAPDRPRPPVDGGLPRPPTGGGLAASPSDVGDVRAAPEIGGNKSCWTDIAAHERNALRRRYRGARRADPIGGPQAAACRGKPHPSKHRPEARPTPP
ncbi:hypothetical protein FAIPA1_30151 [Frankia sp. AiPs1]